MFISTLNVLRLFSDQAAIQHLSNDSSGDGVGFVSALSVVVVVVKEGGVAGSVGTGTTCLFRRSVFVNGADGSLLSLVEVVVVVDVVVVGIVVIVVVNPGCQVESHVVVRSVVVVVEVVVVKC